ncbi:MAG: putative toxin-antitoxin system toxin component, PIN family [Xanthomonadales bacterium]|nr:putative toxin-antitoxin system toxin component, PIN family [Xanthomonadales bacterium]MCB1641032.1 putative toxin-antitoxin system toxin component, PIN family [Xanthomonadales bacterium]
MPDSAPKPDASVVQPLRAVLDTNVWLDLLLFGDTGSAGIRRAIDKGRLLPLLDAGCLEEFRRVLGYAQWALSTERQQQLWQAARHWLQDPLGPLPPALPRCRDPDDQKFLELAARGGAQMLLTRDRDLLMLARRCRKLGLFHILSPADFDDQRDVRPLQPALPSVF